MKIEALLNIKDVDRWLERYGLHFNPRRPSLRGLGFIHAFQDPERLNEYVAVYKSNGGATVTLRTHAGDDCVVELHAGGDSFVKYLLERAARN